MAGSSRFGLRGICLMPRLRYGHRCPRLCSPVPQHRFIIGAASPCTRNKYTTSYVHGHDNFPAPPLVGKTLANVLDETTEKYPDEEFVVFPEDGHRKTFSQFQKEVNRLAAGLVAIGVKRGDRIGIWGPNSLEWLLTLLASARIGAVLVNLSPAYQADEVEYALKKANVRIVVAATPFKTQRYYDILASICPELETASPEHLKLHRLPDLKSVITMGDSQHPGALSFNDVMDMGRTEHYDIIEKGEKSIQFDDIMNIQFTSGTTGRPKATCLTHFHLVNNVILLENMIKTGGVGKATCIPIPLFHTGGMSSILNGLCTGRKNVFPSAGFNATTCLRAIHEERCTSLVVVPTMLVDILHHPNFSTFDLSSLETVTTGGSPVPSELLKKINTAINAKINVMYGMTEATLVVIASLFSDPEEARMKSAGRACPWTELKVTNPSTKEIVDVNTLGELCIRSPYVMTGYFDDEEKTKETIDHARWLHTGDLAMMDADGRVEILGRSKDMVIRGGENIFPVQVEALLHQHPKIEDVQVIGVPDTRMIEELCACVRLKAGETCTEEELKNFCKGKISYFMIPRYVRFVDSFPITQSGKVQKFQLKTEMVKQMKEEGILKDE